MKFPYSLHIKSLSLQEILIGLTLLCYPSLLFLIQGGMNTSLFLLAAISLYVLFHRGIKIRLDKMEWTFALAMMSGLIAILISQLYHQDMSARYFDSASRFLLAVPIFLALRRINTKTLSWLQYAFPSGAIAAFAIVMLKDPTVRYIASTSFINHIHLGDLALMVGTLSVLSINWVQIDHLMIKMFKIMGLIAGLSISVFSSARGGWIAIPVFLMIPALFWSKKNIFYKVLWCVFLTAAIGLLGYVFIDPIHQRLWLLFSELSSYATGNVDTSSGGRLQLWKAALRLISENPILGVGADGFRNAMDQLSASGFISAYAASVGKGEVHNEILANAVRFGLFGLLSILAIYFVPFYFFLRAVKTGTQQQISSAIMGMCLTLGFFVFGLTVETFDLKMTAAFYSLTVAVLLAATYRSAEGTAHYRGHLNDQHHNSQLEQSPLFETLRGEPEKTYQNKT